MWLIKYAGSNLTSWNNQSYELGTKHKTILQLYTRNQFTISEKKKIKKIAKNP